MAPCRFVVSQFVSRVRCCATPPLAVGFDVTQTSGDSVTYPAFGIGSDVCVTLHYLHLSRRFGLANPRSNLACILPGDARYAQPSRPPPSLFPPSPLQEGSSVSELPRAPRPCPSALALLLQSSCNSPPVAAFLLQPSGCNPVAAAPLLQPAIAALLQQPILLPCARTPAPPGEGPLTGEMHQHLSRHPPSCGSRQCDLSP